MNEYSNNIRRSQKKSSYLVKSQTNHSLIYFQEILAFVEIICVIIQNIMLMKSDIVQVLVEFRQFDHKLKPVTPWL